ncbi:MAG: malate synthase A [Bacteroidetes bacterium]|nr:MAG: malate synthase A [Bacteroidota bacterium]
MNTTLTSTPTGVDLRGGLSPAQAEILSADALAFIVALQRRFNARRLALLEARASRKARLQAGELPTFLPETRCIRESDWKVAPVPADLQDRRVEITGPVDRKMIINALNSGAKVFMADFEDANAPSWGNCLDGQVNLREAVNRTLTYEDPVKGKFYQLNPNTATLMVRPRGWHLEEKHLYVDGAPMSGSLFDFGLFFFHNAINLISRGSGPYFYLPKLESHLEARLWNDVFLFAQSWVGLPMGTIKATVLIETILASFELDEILYELRDHSAGLNCGRWDYIFSFIKCLGHRPEYLMPDRAQVTMTAPFMEAYSSLVIKTCHRRGAHAMGGMAAQIPIKSDPEANAQALAKVAADKKREAQAGHDGTWVAHPGLVPVALEQFDRYMPGPNQLHKLREDVKVTATDLIAPLAGSITEAGLRTNIDVGIRYLASWLCGHGCVPIYHLMEDAATAEISRTQVWQWLHHDEAALDDGRKLSLDLYRDIFADQLDRMKAELGDTAFEAGRFPLAADLFDQLVTQDELAEFLTLEAYRHLD